MCSTVCDCSGIHSLHTNGKTQIGFKRPQVQDSSWHPPMCRHTQTCLHPHTSVQTVLPVCTSRCSQRFWFLLLRQSLTSQASLKLTVVLRPQHSKCWDYRSESHHSDTFSCGSIHGACRCTCTPSVQTRTKLNQTLSIHTPLCGSLHSGALQMHTAALLQTYRFSQFRKDLPAKIHKNKTKQTDDRHPTFPLRSHSKKSSR